MSKPLNLPVAAALTGRRTAPDHVAEVLRDAILTGRLEEGEELNQVALAGHFEVSRVPVREALRQLQAEGLIRQEAHHRAVVSSLSLERIMEMLDLRVLLETYMLELALPRVGAAELQHLEDILARMPGADHHQWLRLNREFHESLYELSGASYTQQLAAQIAARTTRYLYQRSGGTGIDRAAEADREHREILSAVRDRNLHRAKWMLETHIEGTRRGVQQFFANRAGPDPAATPTTATTEEVAG